MSTKLFYLRAVLNKKMEKQRFPFGMIIGRMMHEMGRVFKKRANEQAEIKIPNEQFALLYAISLKEDDVIQKDMAEVMRKDKSGILRLIDSLEEKELISRVADTKDRRKNCLMVTKKGKEVIEQYLKLMSELMEQLQQGLTASEMNTFYKVADHIKSNAEKL